MSEIATTVLLWFNGFCVGASIIFAYYSVVFYRAAKRAEALNALEDQHMRILQVSDEAK